MQKVRDTKQTKQIKSNPQQKLPICYGFGTEPIVQLNAVHDFFLLLGTDMCFINSTNYPTNIVTRYSCESSHLCFENNTRESLIQHNNLATGRRLLEKTVGKPHNFLSWKGHSKWCFSSHKDLGIDVVKLKVERTAHLTSNQSPASLKPAYQLAAFCRSAI